MRIGLASDHEGFELKEGILRSLTSVPLEIVDYGANYLDPLDDYPDFVIPLAKAVASRELNLGIAICGSGIGASIAANKVKGIRAGLVHDLFSARQGVEDDDMNIMCLGARSVTVPAALDLIHTFLSAAFIGNTRHQRRLDKISKMEERETRL